MPIAFTHDTPAQRVLLGAGSAARHVAAEVARLDACRMLLMTRTTTGPLETALARTAATVWSEVAQHVPVELADRATATARAAGVDVIVAVGGGSAIGLAKAVALATGIPIIAVPTTFAGSEATEVWGLTEGGRKTTGVDRRVLPVSVVYDADLTAALPHRIAVASGLNGVAHCVDSLWAPRADPVNAALAGEGLRALAAGLRALGRETSSTGARETMQYGAYLAGTAFSSAGSGMHHKICHVLGGTFLLPHAETHAVVLGHVAAFNASAAPEAMRRIADALGTADGVDGLAELARDVAAPRSLASLGFAQEDIPRAVELILPAIPASNPRAADAAAIERLVTAAWAGAPTEGMRA